MAIDPAIDAVIQQMADKVAAEMGLPAPQVELVPWWDAIYESEPVPFPSADEALRILADLERQLWQFTRQDWFVAGPNPNAEGDRC